MEPEGDLGGLMLTALRVEGGFGKFTITLPGAGGYSVNVIAGVGETILLIPDAVEARIDVTGGFSNVDMADDRFTSPSDKVWETPGYQDAEDKVRVSITAGVGQVTVDSP